MLIWVVGSGGLLGGAVAEAAARDGAELFPASPVPWADATRASDTLRSDLAAFRALADGGRWGIAWCAGSSIVASDTRHTQLELSLLRDFVEALQQELPDGRGVFFLSSSAGGVYAGADDPPFTASTPPHPVSPYGELKLDQEAVATAALDGRLPVVIGRLSNLYGPRTDPSKGQGLIPSLCRAVLHRTPLNLYVSMDTIRDYLFADDAGELVWESMSIAVESDDLSVRVEIIASGAATTVAHAVATVQTVAHRKVPLALGTHSSSRHQAIDLRLVPSRPNGARALTPLASGVKRILDSISSESA